MTMPFDPSALDQDGPPSKTVGHRRLEGRTWVDSLQLQRTLSAMRGTGALVPRGVYRFATFDEADEWMTRTTARTHVSLKQKMSPASARR